MVASAMLASACHWARPVTYGLPPGQSASYSPSQREPAVAYAKMFCSVLSTEFSQWGDCKNYVLMDTSYPAEPLDALPTDWTILRIGGLGAQCVADTTTAFEDAGTHLWDKHRIESHHVPVGAFDSSERNAARIRDFVLQMLAQHPSKKFIVVAHSKGAADTLVALALYGRQLTQVKAVITIAGAVGGSWLVDPLETLNERLLRDLELPSCVETARAGEPNAFDSMRRDVRQKFLADHEPSAPLAFSITAVSTREQTSEILKPLWDRVSPYAMEQDSHLVERETVVPWGTFLGRAHGDHWAVAMPYDPNPKVTEKQLRKINRNKYPREALVEAALRVAVKELAAPESRSGRQ
jgi:pimeloyl-ACP methyl ester carboxylesterase